MKAPSPSKHQRTIVVTTALFHKDASQTEENRGVSSVRLAFLQPVVSPKDNTNSCIHLGGGRVRSYKPIDVEEFTHASHRNAQTVSCFV